jgi:RNA polymerase sigma-70 factor (ECF subfamily)
VALARACADGNEEAWDRFVRDFRPILYRAADALDPSGGARDLADSLYADLFGLKEKGGERQSLLRYYHGRSSLATWLRAVLAQRYVDRVRARRRVDPLPEDDSPAALPAPEAPVDPDRARWLGLMRDALERALAALPPRDRLRLACYYADDSTLAETGRVLGEHEATASRNLSRTRTAIRAHVERQLNGAGLGEAEVERCFACAAEDAGTLDLRDLLGARNEPLERSR